MNIKYSKEEYCKAHQYLYYCLAQPVLTDYEYDQWGSKNRLDYKNGSDSESSYSEKEKELAYKILKGDLPSLI